jgi:hypothetical protein
VAIVDIGARNVGLVNADRLADAPGVELPG